MSPRLQTLLAKSVEADGMNPEKFADAIIDECVLLLFKLDQTLIDLPDYEQIKQYGLKLGIKTIRNHFRKK